MRQFEKSPIFKRRIIEARAMLSFLVISQRYHGCLNSCCLVGRGRCIIYTEAAAKVKLAQSGLILSPAVIEPRLLSKLKAGHGKHLY